MGVMHGDEVEYVFGHATNASRNFTESERQLSFRIMNHFATFAKTGSVLQLFTLRTALVTR